MKSWLKHPLRVTLRLLWLGGELALGAMLYLFQCAFRSAEAAPNLRALWLHRICRRLLRVFALKVQIVGVLPQRGFMVSNHLSYVDIVLLAAISPTVFVAKREVRNWPVFGGFARLAGTLFVNRESRSQVGLVADEIEARLQQGALVVLFPEGTSSDGKTVLPFKSSLLEPATRSSQPLTTALIHYELPGGDVGEEVCYWKDMTLVPHLINLLSKPGLRATVSFASSTVGDSDRKQLAIQLHAQILQMKANLPA
jgi:1-acyl-sn-glycerol-3-phosphate acyltransferase